MTINDLQKLKTVKDFDKYLIKNGFELRPRSGSHAVYKNGNKSVCIPNHGRVGEEISKGVKRTIIKQLLA